MSQSTPSAWARRRLDFLIDDYLATEGDDHRHAGCLIRELVRVHPTLGDLIPAQVWKLVYRVRAVGTIAPIRIAR